MKKKVNIIGKLLIKLIKVYQFLFSPDHSFWAKALNKPPYCKFIPSCSCYMIGAIEECGVIKGILKGFNRILRCNPYNKGGYDPVKKETKK